MDRLLLRIPVFGSLVRKSVIARWTRTLSTMFAAGVPLVESLDSVGGAAGNIVYKIATKPVSYTHLDVYKRQGQRQPGQRKQPAQHGRLACAGTAKQQMHQQCHGTGLQPPDLSLIHI